MAEKKRGLKTGEKILFWVFGVFLLVAAVGFYFMDLAAQKDPSLFKPLSHYDFSEAGLKGSMILRKSGCTTCHRALREGTNMGLSLDGIGSKYNADRIYAFLKRPAENYPDKIVDHAEDKAAAYVAKMPDEELRLMSVFLSELKADRGSSEAVQPPEGPSSFIDKMLSVWAPAEWKSKYKDVRGESK